MLFERRLLQTISLAIALSFACGSIDIAEAKKKKSAPAPDSDGGTVFTPTTTTQPIPSVTTPVTSPLDVVPPPGQQPQPRPEFLDLSSGKFDKLDLDLSNSSFSNAAIDKLHITATNMDFKAVLLKGLSIDVSGGKFTEFVFDRLMLETQGDLNFNPDMLMSDKVLQLAQPANANVFVLVNQDSLNAFLNSPRTLEKLSVTANKRVGMIASMLGANASNFGITLSDASVALQKDNHISIATKATMGMGGLAVPVPLELNAKLDLANGWIAVSETHLNTNGQEISPQLSEMLVKKINGLAGWGSKSEDIQFSFTDLKVVPGKSFMLKGTARISRLRFGKQAKEPTQ